MEASHKTHRPQKKVGKDEEEEEVSFKVKIIQSPMAKGFIDRRKRTEDHIKIIMLLREIC